ncbi:hypothetical protein GOP47_0007881 [Adiantum capillus-veneris]|uniref:Major facilitator superfamily (MFS) profile domain-containing protein n=1 Tax=Adiantum capillus-veneris TaxID=13818 RepID=A0A9D4V332_ADICA|nr:hypothetical protein GOP47_0007881 [Adiantum capillus-veneris]
MPVYITNSSMSLTWPLNMMYQRRLPLNLTQNRPSLKSAWAPFDGTSGTALLGDVDVAFLASYSIGMYIAGHLGDLLDLRWFLSGGMVGSGMIVCLFGLAYWWNVHWLGYFFIVHILGGFVQATGWPSVVSIIGNWFGKSKRGLIMGVWNAHTSIGNIWGTLMASSVLKYGWGWSFIVPGCALIAGGIVMFLFLVVDPKIVGLASPYDIVQGYASSSDGDEERGHPESKEVKTEAKLDWKKQPLLGKGGKSLQNYEEDSEHSPVGFFYTQSCSICIQSFLCKAGGIHIPLLVAILHQTHRDKWGIPLGHYSRKSLNCFRCGWNAWWHSSWLYFG